MEKKSFKSQMAWMPALCFKTTVVSAWGLAQELRGATYLKKKQVPLREGGPRMQMTQDSKGSLQLNKQI